MRGIRHKREPGPSSAAFIPTVIYSSLQLVEMMLALGPVVDLKSTRMWLP